MTAIKKNLGNFAAILGLIVIAAGVSVYILNEQRMRFPFFEPKPFQLKVSDKDITKGAIERLAKGDQP